MKISVVVPTFNGEKYISKCIDSILNQTYSDFEIVIVDDGSTDKTADILKDYVNLDSRIKTIRIENGGANYARYKGLLNSTGDYVTFIDCDDWIENVFFSETRLHIEENKADIIITGMIREFSENNKNINEFEYGLLPPGEYKEEEINNQFLNLIIMENSNDTQELYSVLPNLHGKFFKRSILINAKWDIPRRIFFGEDGVVVYSSLIKSKYVIKINKAYYHYVQNNSSVSHLRNPLIFENIEGIYQIYIELFRGLKFEKELLEQLNKYIKILCGSAISRMYNISFGNKYFFDFGMLLENKKRVVLYGAGRVGQDYMDSLERTSNVEVILWVDKNYKSKLGNIKSVDSIISENFDFIIVAVAYEYVAEEIKKELISIGIDEKKIVWNRPLRGIT